MSMWWRRRRRLATTIDDRELVTIGDRVLTCDEFKAGAMIRMARHDSLPSAEYRALCNDLNVHAGDVATLAKRGLSADDIRRKAEAKLGQRR